MKDQNDKSMFVVIIVLCVIALIWALVNLFDGTKVFEVSETTSGTILLNEGGQNG